MKLTGEPHPSDRMVTVQPTPSRCCSSRTALTTQVCGRVSDTGSASLAASGPECSPSTPAPVELDVTVDHLVTMDGHDIERCTVRVTVQLSDRDRYASCG